MWMQVKAPLLSECVRGNHTKPLTDKLTDKILLFLINCRNKNTTWDVYAKMKKMKAFKWCGSTTVVVGWRGCGMQHKDEAHRNLRCYKHTASLIPLTHGDPPAWPTSKETCTPEWVEWHARYSRDESETRRGIMQHAAVCLLGASQIGLNVFTQIRRAVIGFVSDT